MCGAYCWYEIKGICSSGGLNSFFSFNSASFFMVFTKSSKIWQFPVDFLTWLVHSSERERSTTRSIFSPNDTPPRGPPLRFCRSLFFHLSARRFPTSFKVTNTCDWEREALRGKIHLLSNHEISRELWLSDKLAKRKREPDSMSDLPQAQVIDLKRQIRVGELTWCKYI